MSEQFRLDGMSAAETARRLEASRRSVMRWAAGSAVAAGVVGLGRAGGSAAPARQDGAPYVEVLALTTLPYFIDHKAGLEFAGQQLGVPTKFVGPAEYDMNAMISTMEEVIAQKPAGLLVNRWRAWTCRARSGPIWARRRSICRPMPRRGRPGAGRGGRWVAG